MQHLFQRLPLAKTLIALSLVSLPGMANAAILFSNFSPAGGSGFNTSTLAIDSRFVGNGGNGLTRWAAPFSITSNSALTSADVAFRYTSGTNSFIATVTEDGPSFSRPDETQVLASGTLNNIPSTVGIVTFSFAQTPTLLAGRTYWLVLSPGTSLTGGRWHFNTTGDTGSAVTTQTSGGWDPNSATAPAFRVNGTVVVVPEAGTLALLAAGVAPVAVLIARRRSKAK